MRRVLVFHSAQAAADLRDLLIAQRNDIEVSIGFREPVAASRPDLVAVARTLFPVVIINEHDLATFAELDQFDGITTTVDTELEFVDDLRISLGRAVATGRPWRKDVQRHALASLSSTMQLARSASTDDELRIAASELGYPLVVKPVRGAGGDGVLILRDASDLHRYMAVRTHGALVAEPLLHFHGVHPRVPTLGNLMSLEFGSAGGQHQLLAVFGKFPVTSVLTREGESEFETPRVNGDVFPSLLPDSDVMRTTQMVSEALERLGVDQRITHTEVLLTPSGPEIVEINGRMGGYLTRLLHLTSQYDLTRQVLALSVGDDVEAIGPVSGFAAGYFPSLPRTFGTVRSAPTSAEIRALPGVVGIDALARSGHPASNFDARMCNITLFERSESAFAGALGGIGPAVHELFHADVRHGQGV